MTMEEECTAAEKLNRWTRCLGGEWMPTAKHVHYDDYTKVCRASTLSRTWQGSRAQRLQGPRRVGCMTGRESRRQPPTEVVVRLVAILERRYGLSAPDCRRSEALASEGRCHTGRRAMLSRGLLECKIATAITVHSTGKPRPWRSRTADNPRARPLNSAFRCRRARARRVKGSIITARLLIEKLAERGEEDAFGDDAMYHWPLPEILPNGGGRQRQRRSSSDLGRGADPTAERPATGRARLLRPPTLHMQTASSSWPRTPARPSTWSGPWKRAIASKGLRRKSETLEAWANRSAGPVRFGIAQVTPRASMVLLESIVLVTCESAGPAKHRPYLAWL